MGIRRDGREPDDLRPLAFTRDFTQFAAGSVLVEFGQTRVLCTASVEERVPPWLRGKGRGWVTAEYSMLPGSTSERNDREAAKGKQSLSNFLRKAANLSPVAIGLLQEAAKASGMSLSSLSPVDLARLIRAVPVRLNGVSPIARAISTAGGIAFDELDSDLMLRRVPSVFAAGEMLDWEAPTGGYLLQASFATGAVAGRGALKWLNS